MNAKSAKTRFQALEAQFRAGAVADAEQGCRAWLADHPEDSAAFNLLGLIAHGRGNFDDAANWLGRALAVDGDNVGYHTNLGLIELARKNWLAAIAPLEKAAALAPEAASSHFHLGMALRLAGRSLDCARAFERAARLDPDDAECQFQLGLALGAIGKNKAAIEAYRRAIGKAPKRAEILVNLGALLADDGDQAEAEALFRLALTLAPGSVTALNNLALLLHRTGRPDQAETTYQQALGLAPDNAEILNNYGNLQVDRGQVAIGLALYEQALVAQPSHDGAYVNILARANLIADWTRISRQLPALPKRLEAIAAEPGRAASLLPLAFSLPYISSNNAVIDRVLTLVGQHVARSVGDATPIEPKRHPEAPRRLRLAYLSADFGDHPISHVTLPIYGLHDRRNFEVAAYSLRDRGNADGGYLKAIRAACDRFVDLSGLSNSQAANRIAQDGVDILIDLAGYMQHSRPQILAMRPAPIQVYWQGHTGSLGARHIDYVLGDGVVMPRADQVRYVEKIVRLPDCFSSADRPLISSLPLTRAQFGLPDDAPVFCAFNNPLKIEPETFDCWMRILRAAPDSVLWLTGSKDPTLRANLSTAAAARGVAPPRLVFAERISDKAVHLARHRLADLFLDSFKFNASTTALDALWSGLPLITRLGNNAYSRLASSYLRALGLEDLIAISTAAYESTAIALALHPERLDAARAKLMAQRLRAPLFDAARFVRHLEWGFTHMWREHVAGRPPASFDVPVLAQASAPAVHAYAAVGG